MHDEEPRALDVLREGVLGNHLARPTYRRYIENPGLTGDEEILEFGSESGICSRYIVRMLTRVDLSLPLTDRTSG
jgi:hypothetical protein